MNLLVYVAVLLMPLVGANVGLGVLAHAGIVVKAIELFLAATILSWSVLRGVAPQPRATVLIAVLCALTVESALSLLWADQPGWGLDTKRPLNFLEYLFFLLPFIFSPERRELARGAAKAYCVSAVMIAAASISTAARIVVVPGFQRQHLIPAGPIQIGTIAIFDGPATYAAWLLPLLVASLVLARTSGGKWWFAAGMAAFAVILNGSRATWLVTALAVPVTWAVAQRGKSRLRYTVGAAFMFTMAAAIVLIRSGAWHALVQLRGLTVIGRILGYETALRLALTNPLYALFGAGKDRFVNAMLQTLGEAVVPHNVLLEELVADGLVGLTLLSIFACSAYALGMRAVKRKNVAAGDKFLIRSALISLLMIVVAHGLFAPILAAYGVWVCVAIMVGLSLDDEVTATQLARRPNTTAQASYD